MLFSTSMSSKLWGLPWLDLFIMLWSLGVCFTHFDPIVLCHALHMHHICTPHAPLMRTLAQLSIVFCISLILHVSALITWLCDIVFVPFRTLFLFYGLDTNQVCVFVLCFCTCFSTLCLFVQMSPTKHSASKKSSKRPRMNSENFRTIEADMAYNDCYKRAIIIMERVVRMETLENTSIPEVFKERTSTKLLNPSGNLFAKIIREFFANAPMEGDHIIGWVRQKEFIIIRDSIQEFLDVCPHFSQSLYNMMID